MTYDKPDGQCWQRIPVLVEYKLLHGWYISNAGFAVPPPPPAGPELRTLITERRKHMMPADRSLPSNALNSPAWPQRYEEDRRRACAGGRPCERAFQQCRPPCLVSRPRRRCHAAAVARDEPPHIPFYYPQASALCRLYSGCRQGQWRLGARPPSGGVVIDDGARRASSAPARRTTGSVQHR
jgi:hypothetical protein